MADETDTTEAPPAPEADAASQPMELPGNLTAPGSAPDGSQEGEPEDWRPPQTDEHGFAIDDHGLPINLRRRALTLADRGDGEDPAQAVGAKAIADATDQLTAYDAEYPALSGMTKTALRSQAETEGVAVDDDALVDDIRAAIEAARPPRI